MISQSTNFKLKRTADDVYSTASSGSSSNSSLKAASSFVSSLSSKGWAVFGKKLKSTTLSFDNKKNDSIQQQYIPKLSVDNNEKISKNNSSSSSFMECSPSSTKSKAFTFQSGSIAASTASSMTLGSAASLAVSTSSIVHHTSSTLKMEIDDIPELDPKETNNMTKLPKLIEERKVSNPDVNEKVETLVLRVLSPEAIQVVNYISAKIDSLSKYNSKQPENSLGNKTILFCGRKEPSVSLNAFMLRLVTLLNWVFDKGYDSKGLNSTGIRYLVLSIMYIEKALNLNPDLKLIPLNVHRLFLGATIDALTFYEDSIPDKTIMARIGGVDEKQIRILGARFLQCIGYNLWINQADFIQQFRNICEPLKIDFVPDIPSWQV